MLQLGIEAEAAARPLSRGWRRLSVVVWQFSIFRHRHHPHGAERGNHRDIHNDPHDPIPDFTQ
jgi:hypothetical protein